MPQEFLLTTNDYNEPKVLEGKDAIAAKLLLLLNMVPGTNPLHLEMGVDLSGRYRFCSEDDVDDLYYGVESLISKIQNYLKTHADGPTLKNEDFDVLANPIKWLLELPHADMVVSAMQELIHEIPEIKEKNVLFNNYFSTKACPEFNDYLTKHAEIVSALL